MKVKIKHLMMALGLATTVGASSMWMAPAHPRTEAHAVAQPLAVTDTTYSEDDIYPQPRKGILYADIKVLARSYKDSVVIRWVGEDFVTQDYLYQYGVDIIREMKNDSTGLRVDTLVTGFKPWSKQQFMDHYPQSDSLAYMAIGLLYNDEELTQDQTKSAPGTLGSLIDVSDDQNMRTGFSLLVSEWRGDLADRMALRWVDRDVVVGGLYEYFVVPTKFDTTYTFPVRSGRVDVFCFPQPKDSFNVACGDSIVGPHKVRLWWENRNYSSYEIERRQVKANGDTTAWKRITETPIVVFENETRKGEKLDCYRGDVVPTLGDYEYRIFAHDAFGDLTDPSPIIKVHMPDLTPPRPPQLTYVEIDRQDPDDLSKQVMCTFHFHKDTLEEDYAGMHLYYYNERYTQKEWKKLNPVIIGRTDTTCVVDMTGFGSGMVVVAAVDSAGNMGYSMPRMVQIRDMRPPRMMKNFRAHPNAERGYILLTWEPDSLDDDIEYYELAVANDTTHAFVLANRGKLKQTHFVDTIAMDVNQRYIYYKVRAIDYSTNESDYTPILQVQRPTNRIPSKPFLSKSSVDSLGVHMEWGLGNDQVIDYHKLYKKRECDSIWTELGTYTADSINAIGNLLRVSDLPECDMDTAYQYCMESFGYNGRTSEKSLAYTTRFEGPRFFDWSIRLESTVDADKREATLKWNLTEPLPYKGDWYFCLYYKGFNDDQPRFLMSLPADTRQHATRVVRRGETGIFSIKVKYDNGRETTFSNSVLVEMPAKADAEQPTTIE